LKSIFDQWQLVDTAALLSNLEKNQELKSALLEETPWVREAQSETQQKKMIARLFDTHLLAKEQDKNLKKLIDLQLPDGSFPWFKGIKGNRYITQYIISGLGRLQHLKISSANKGISNKLIKNALNYLDEQLVKDYRQLRSNKADLNQKNLTSLQIQYLYMRSFFPQESLSDSAKAALMYYEQQAAQYWPEMNPYLKGLIALALHRQDQTKTPPEIMTSLKETALHDRNQGIYWKQEAGSWWYEAPIES